MMMRFNRRPFANSKSTPVEWMHPPQTNRNNRRVFLEYVYPQPPLLAVRSRVLTPQKKIIQSLHTRYTRNGRLQTVVIMFDGCRTKNDIDPFLSDDIPQKRSRTSRSILLSVRKSVSEPATRDVTPVEVLRMTSVPLKKRKVFDGVQVPTFREVSRQKMAQEAGTNKNILSTGQGLVSVPRTPSSSSPQRKKRTSPSMGSDEDDLDWENFHVDATSSGECDFCIELGIY